MKKIILPFTIIYFFVTLSLSKGQIKIYNSLGEKIFETSNAEKAIDISSFQNGIYNLILTSKDKLIEKKIIVTK